MLKAGEKETARVVRALLPAVDSFEAARTQLTVETEGEEKVNDAYQGVYKQLAEAFRGLGVESVDTVGRQFDPEIHEAVMQEPSDSATDGEVVREFRKGFAIGSGTARVLLRPAMVVVASNDAKPYVPPAEVDDEGGVSGEDTVGEGDTPAEEEATDVDADVADA